MAQYSRIQKGKNMIQLEAVGIGSSVLKKHVLVSSSKVRPNHR